VRVNPGRSTVALTVTGARAWATCFCSEANGQKTLPAVPPLGRSALSSSFDASSDPHTTSRPETHLNRWAKTPVSRACRCLPRAWSRAIRNLPPWSAPPVAQFGEFVPTRRDQGARHHSRDDEGLPRVTIPIVLLRQRRDQAAWEPCPARRSSSVPPARANITRGATGQIDLNPAANADPVILLLVPHGAVPIAAAARDIVPTAVVAALDPGKTCLDERLNRETAPGECPSTANHASADTQIVGASPQETVRTRRPPFAPTHSVRRLLGSGDCRPAVRPPRRETRVTPRRPACRTRPPGWAAAARACRAIPPGSSAVEYLVNGDGPGNGVAFLDDHPTSSQCSLNSHHPNSPGW